MSPSIFFKDKLAHRNKTNETQRIFRYTICLSDIAWNFTEYQLNCLKTEYQTSEMSLVLTHFSPVSHFYTPWKRQKTYGFLTFSGGIEM